VLAFLLHCQEHVANFNTSIQDVLTGAYKQQVR
jgi:hypothetical protein